MRVADVHRKMLACILGLGLCATGCYHYRAEAPGPGGVPGTDYQGQVIWSLAWGLVQESPDIANCNDQPLSEVTVSSNLGFSLITILTLGFASPAQMRWKCAKPRPGVGGFGALPPAPCHGAIHARRS